MTSENPTLTPDARRAFQALADEAVADIGALPTGSQPLWFRSIRAALTATDAS